MATVEEIKAKMLTIETKLDQIINILKKKQEDDIEKHEWTAEIYTEKYMLITSPFHTEFKNYLKSLGATWNSSKKGWLFPEALKDEIINKIQTQFPYWLFLNNLIKEEQN